MKNLRRRVTPGHDICIIFDIHDQLKAHTITHRMVDTKVVQLMCIVFETLHKIL